MGGWSRVRGWLLGACIAMPLLLVGCDGGSPQGTATPSAGVVATPTGEGGEIVLPPEAATITPAPSPVGLTEADRVAVYARAIGVLLERDLGTRFIYVSPYLGQGEHLDNPDVDTPVPPALVEQLEQAYHERVFEVRDFSDATKPLEEGGRVKNEGIFITLGPITNDSSAREAVGIRISFYRGFGDARGDLYRFGRDPAAPLGWKLLEAIEEWNDKTTP